MARLGGRMVPVLCWAHLLVPRLAGHAYGAPWRPYGPRLVLGSSTCATTSWTRLWRALEAVWPRLVLGSSTCATYYMRPLTVYHHRHDRMVVYAI